MNKEITIGKAQKLVDEWIKKYGVRYFNELTNMAILTEEVGEVARIMARRYGEQSEKKSDEKANLSDELADVFFVLVCLANQTGEDLEEPFQKNLDKKTRSIKQRQEALVLYAEALKRKMEKINTIRQYQH